MRKMLSIEPRSGPLAEFTIRRTVFFRHDVFVKWANDHKQVVSTPAKRSNDSLKGMPLQRSIKLHPFKLRCSLASLGPGFMTRAFCTAHRVISRRGGDPQR